jgi:putative endonuclease
MASEIEHGPHELGRWGERTAERHLVRRGWRVLARNHRFGRREVDLIVSRGGVLAFVEVKTRAGEGFGSPAEAVTALKRREIETVAAHYLAHRAGSWAGVRFDVVSIVRDTPSGRVRVEHVEDAWRPGWG